MKTMEAYLDDYLDDYNLLKSKNELWRLKYTPQEFLKIVEQAKSRAAEDREMGYLTEYHLQQNETNVIAVALQDKFILSRGTYPDTNLKSGKYPVKYGNN